MSETASATAPRPMAEAHPAGTRLRRHPVDGSVLLGLMPVQPQPSAAWAQLFPVDEQTPRRARLTTEMFLANCQDIPEGVSEDAVLLVSELVTNAYKAMGTEPLAGIGCIELSLRLFADHLLIEVIDSSPKAPVPNPSQNAEAENWRGLAVVQQLSREWGYFWRIGRKVVYCRLPVSAALVDGPLGLARERQPSRSEKDSGHG